MKKDKLPAILMLLVSVISLASHPEILNLLPEKWAFIGSAIGILGQGFTRALK